jgi:nucleotide-binding universal stress UspA family protein
MHRFKNILLVTSAQLWERPSLERAMELAMRNRGRLAVIGVLERLPRDIQMLLPTTPPTDLQDLAMQDLRERLEQFVKPVRKKGLRLGVEVRIGTPFIEVIRDVLGHGHDLVMMSAEGGGGGLKGLLFGSTSMHLMRKCPCPVWVFKPVPHKRFVRILAAVDPDPFDKQKDALAVKILELATSLARLEGSELQVIHAWSVYRENKLPEWHASSNREAVDTISRDTEATHGRWLNELLAKHKLTGIRHNVRLLHGEPAEVIIKLAARRRVDLIVMGTVGRTGIPGFFIGNTAETVLRQVNCSVLAVKPDGFVSPVQQEEQTETRARTPALERNTT